MEITGPLRQLTGYDKVERSDSSSSRNGKGRASSSSSSASRSDSVTLSNEGRLVSQAVSTANSTPDVRQKKIDELKALVQSGQYKPDLKKTAQKLVEEDLDLLI